MLQQHIKHLKIIISAMSLLLAPCANAININVNSNTNALTAALTGPNVTITNLIITGGCANSTNGVGLFTNGTTGGAGPVLSEPTGVVVSSGGVAGPTNRLDSSNNDNNVFNAMCNSASSDTDMVAIETNVSSGEYAAIEFDVVPQSTTLAIPFQFGSDEFPEYVCSAFNDIVGIFVSGPGITSSTPVFSNAPGTNGGPTSVYENYAKTANGDLSSINWVNTGVVGQNGNAANCGSLTNAAFYLDNSNGNATGGNATVAISNANLEMDGFTNTLFQPITVVPGQIYHVKIAVADAGDRGWDSAAFIHPLFSTGTFSGFDYGDAPNAYGTLTSNAGPSHGIDNTIFMGAVVPDNEVTGIPSVNADGDDLDVTDDEDGITSFPVLVTSAPSYSVNVNVTNTSGNPARLIGWIDFNRNGSFESGEGTLANIANGTNGAAVVLNWPTISGLVAGNTYARIRFSSDPGLSIFTTGSGMSDGEIEDYPLTIIVGTANITVSKDSAVISDPVNATSNPKAIPGAIVEYTVVIENTGSAYVDSDTLLLTDPIDPITTFYFGSPLNPVVFADGANTSGLTFTFTSLASTTDDVDFSSDGGTSFVTPTVDANGFDMTAPPINFIRINPKGGFNGSDGVNHPSMEIKFQVRIE